jgi:hypothetical protein
MAVRNFKRGGPGVFNCSTCGRGTRETTQAIGSRLCAQCFELAGLENALMDGCFTDADVPEVKSLHATIIAKGGNAASVQSNFAELLERAGIGQ